MNKIKLILGASILVFGSAANAAIISVDDAVFGVDSVTRDTTSGLEWLDLRFTLNRSFNDVSVNVGAGGDFEGWYGASSGRFLDLLGNWTGYRSTNVITRTAEPTNEAFNLDGLIELLSATTGTVGEGYSGVRAFTGGRYDSSHVWVGQIHDFDENSTTLDSYIPNNFYRPDYLADSQTGTFLVREISAVPAPPAIWLFVTGLIGLVGFARRKQQPGIPENN